MKKRQWLFSFLIFWPAITMAADVVIEVNGIRTIEGNIEILMLNESQASSWPEGGESVCLKKKKVTGPAETLICQNIQPGRYAVSVLHDINGNGKMDKRLVFPIEDYGFSNNQRGLLGPASFEECVFDLGEKNILLIVTLFH